MARRNRAPPKVNVPQVRALWRCEKNLSEKGKGNGFKIFDSSESIYGFNIENGESFTRKNIENIGNYAGLDFLIISSYILIFC